MPDIRADESNTLSWRHTPWDSRAFEISTAEITDLAVTSRDAGEALVRQFERESAADFAYTRVPATDRTARIVLQSSGYYVAECSLELGIGRMGKVDFAKAFRNNLPVEEAVQKDMPALRDIAASSFHFGRFAEDPYIPGHRSAERNARWIDDLFEQAEIVVYRGQDGEPVSFMAFTVADAAARLILGGSREGHGFVSPMFWSTVLTRLKDRGVKRTNTVISAANTGILNLYASLGFTVERTLFGYHKRIGGTMT